MTRRDANPTEANVRRAETAAATAERHDGIVANQQRQVELAQWRQQIPTGAQGPMAMRGPAASSETPSRAPGRPG